MDAILLIDKPAGPTSHDVVHTVRHALKDDDRVGHAGTLDPPASGLLVVLVGRATRLARFTADMRKHYTGVVRFGRETLTDDAAGETRGAESDAWKTLTDEAVARAAVVVQARPEQLPPAISAKKVDGRRAYRIARAGGEPELSPAAVTIYRLEVRRLSETDFALDAECSSGTYIRSIARDLGREAGVPAHLASLRRTAIGPWRVERAIVPDDALAESIAVHWHPMSEAVAHLPRLELHAEDARRFSHGQKLPTELEETTVAVYSGGELLGVAAVEQGLLKPDVVLAA